MWSVLRRSALLLPSRFDTTWFQEMGNLESVQLPYLEDIREHRTCSNANIVPVMPIHWTVTAAFVAPGDVLNLGRHSLHRSPTRSLTLIPDLNEIPSSRCLDYLRTLES